MVGAVAARCDNAVMTYVPATADELTADYLADLIELPVTAVATTIIGTGEGFVGQLARLALSYDDGAPSDAPASLIAKLPTADPGGRFIGEMLRLWEREGRWYREVAPSITVRVPRCYANLADTGESRYLLVLEDLAPSRPGDQVVGASAEQAYRVLGDIARFHAQWWMHPMLEQLDWMPKIDDPTTKMVTPMFAQGWPAFHERFKDVLSARTLDWVERFGPTCADFLDLYADEPVTMIHGDFRLDNMMFGDDGDIALIDWQMSTRAPALSDFVYFVGTNLTDAVRRDHLGGLLHHYATTLASGGVAVPPEEELMDGVRKGILMWMVAMAGGIGQLDPANERGVRLFDAIITRLFHCGDDIDAGQFLDQWLAQWKG